MTFGLQDPGRAFRYALVLLGVTLVWGALSANVSSLRLGTVFAGAALMFDLIVVAGLVRQGLRHFRQTILWVGYAVLIAVPWLVGLAG